MDPRSIPVNVRATDKPTMTTSSVWTYQADDPYAVRVLIDNRVLWVFARDLILHALRPHRTACNGWSGDGDVAVWRPTPHPDGVVLIRLRSPDGECILEVPVRPLARFATDSLRVVSAGREHAVYAPTFDAELAALTGGA